MIIRNFYKIFIYFDMNVYGHMCIKGDIMAIIEGLDRAKYIKKGPSTRRILDESLLHNYSIRPYVNYLQFKHKMRKKRSLKVSIHIKTEIV